MLPPQGVSVRQLSREEGISEATLHKWRSEARDKGRLLPDADSGPEGWSARDKFAAVVEAASLNAADLGEYCRSRGIFPEQLRVWREACERANDWERAAAHRIQRETRDDRKRIQQLERDLARKEKALAEAAALMILRKKAEAIWGPEGGEDA
jgi:transposase-like protein